METMECNIISFPLGHSYTINTTLPLPQKEKKTNIFNWNHPWIKVGFKDRENQQVFRLHTAKEHVLGKGPSQMKNKGRKTFLLQRRKSYPSASKKKNSGIRHQENNTEWLSLPVKEEAAFFIMLCLWAESGPLALAWSFIKALAIISLKFISLFWVDY